MEIKIGVQHSPRELVVETDTDAADVEKAVASALTQQEILRLTDTKGRTILVPASTISYVELGSPNQGTVGFR